MTDSGEPDHDGSARHGVTRVEGSRRLQSIWVTSARMASALLAIAIPMVLTRVLDQSTFGDYKLIFLVAMTATSLLTLGIPGSLYYFVPRDPENSQRYQAQSALSLAVAGIVAGTLIVVLAPTLARLFDAPIERYMGWIGLFVALSVPAALIPASPMVDRRAVLASAILGSVDLLRAGLIIAVALITRDLYAVVIAATIVVATKVGALTRYLVWRGSVSPTGTGDSLELLRRQLAYALPFAGIAVIGLMRNRLHAFFVAASFSQIEFAIYAVATLKLPFIGQMTQTVGEVVVIENSKNYAEGRIDEMRFIWKRATYSLALVLLPVFVIGVVFAQDIMIVLFGPDYAAAGSIFRIYLLLMPLSILIASPMLRATGDLRVMLAADVIALVVTIASLLILVGYLGPAGAVLSLVIGRVTFMALASRRTAQRLHLGIGNFLPWRSLFVLLVVAASAAAVASYVVHTLPVFPRLLLGVGLAGLIIAGIAMRTGLIPESERDLVKAMFGRVLGRKN